MSVRRRARLLGALGAAALAWALAAAPTAAFGAGAEDIVVTVPQRDDDGDGADGTQITNAQLRWGLNAESGGGAFAGGCNFLSAGTAGDAGGARVWRERDGLYAAESGAVRIEKPDADGTWRQATWAEKCLAPNGETVTTASTTSTTGNQVVIDGGVGTRDDGALEIGWKGSFTVVFYGGMTYWSVTDPRLTLDADGSGRLTATASGYGTSMDDMNLWQPIAGRTVVLAEVRGAASARDTGFTVTPEYLGVRTDGGGQVARTAQNADVWGSFPQSFVDFHRLTGQQGYWLTTGGVRDAAKPASPLTVSFDAEEPVPPVTPPTSDGGDAGSVPSNPVVRAPGSTVGAVPSVDGAPQIITAGSPISTQPQAAGLVPQASSALPPFALPLLGSGAALGLGAIAAMSMLRVLPWQRSARV